MQEIHEVAGIRLSAVASNIRYQDRLDLVLIELNSEASVAGVFTQNAFCAAPVQLAKRHMAAANTRAFLVNTGNANAGTGEKGIADAIACCEAASAISGVPVEGILPFSTGVIGEALPVAKITAGVEKAFTELSAASWLDAANGILTTDTRPKLTSKCVEIDGQRVTITGFAKGSGMIKPNMATMLAYIFTDAKISQQSLQRKLAEQVSQSFNRITVDGDTSTNDACMLVATGCSNISIEDSCSSDQELFGSALADVFQELATGLIRDAEGASKFITINVMQGASSAECLQLAYTVAESPLVKTAFFASDPNWGRILAAVGRSGLDDLQLDGVSILLGSCPLVTGGELDPAYTEAKGQQEMDKTDISVTINLGRGECNETVWTSDLSHDYVKINADYRS